MYSKNRINLHNHRQIQASGYSLVPYHDNWIVTTQHIARDPNMCDGPLSAHPCAHLVHMFSCRVQPFTSFILGCQWMVKHHGMGQD